MADRPVLGLSRADLAELMAEPMRAAELEPQAARAVLLRLVPVVEALRIAAAAPVTPPPQPSPNGDELLTVDEVAALLKKPRAAVYSMLRNKALAPAVLHINRRTLRVRKEELMRRLPSG